MKAHSTGAYSKAKVDHEECRRPGCCVRATRNVYDADGAYRGVYCDVHAEKRVEELNNRGPLSWEFRCACGHKGEREAFRAPAPCEKCGNHELVPIGKTPMELSFDEHYPLGRKLAKRAVEQGTMPGPVPSLSDVFDKHKEVMAKLLRSVGDTTKAARCSCSCSRFYMNGNGSEYICRDCGKHWSREHFKSKSDGPKTAYLGPLEAVSKNAAAKKGF